MQTLSEWLTDNEAVDADIHTTVEKVRAERLEENACISGSVETLAEELPTHSGSHHPSRSRSPRHSPRHCNQHPVRGRTHHGLRSALGGTGGPVPRLRRDVERKSSLAIAD
ncbi:hypothetical protein GCM10010244_79310 [Streptomyces coeruleorubidus]|nr:hypothetical protein GCM10010244_79310 [Streptomyces bellus]